MAKLIKTPAEIKACGNKEKIIKEFIGNVNSKTSSISIAKMDSPQGWEEPGQTPKFNEYTVVLKGTLKIETRTESFDVKAGQAVIVKQDEWVKVSTPYEGGAEYIYHNLIALRGGYHSLFARDSETGLTLGAGLNINLFENFILNMDYAYMDFGKLDNTQMLTLSLQF
jgi:opacity protein-like surface antigen